ncbi:MAG: redoxin domain-containing protein [Alphaproteobacteria bacterium]|nr:redoxin domain-containing protein [Alphaproteobacteria bacterium]
MNAFAGFLASSLLITASAGLASAAEPSGANRMAALGPAIGASIPHDLSLPMTDGGEASFEGLVGEAGMALFFVRSVDWCPYCKAQAVDVSARIEEFEERGLSVVFVSYDPVEKQAAFVEQTAFRPALLSDEGIEAINAFGILNESHKPGSRAYGIPHPVIFILDESGVIQAKFYEEDFLTNDKSYRSRPAVDLILEGADAALSPEA